MATALGKTILGLVGGEDNINNVVHCATRLRMSVKDNDKVKKDQLSVLSGVLGVAEGGGQLQIIIGPAVDNVYENLVDGTHLRDAASQDGAMSHGKQSLVTLFFDTVAAIFTPLLPLLAGSGVLRGLILLCTQFHWLSTTSSTYTILTVASTSVFYFLPVLLAFTAADRFHANRYIAVAVMGALIMPAFINLMGTHGNGVVVSFLGLPIVTMTYTSTVIPAVVSVWALSHLERLLRRIIPENLQLVFVSLLSLLIMVPVTAGIIGPLGVYIGEGISAAINWLLVSASWAGGLVVGGVWNIFVIFGLQWAVNPVMIQNLSLHGFDYIVPLTAAANFGMAGATLGFFFKTRDPKMKTYSMSALVSIFFAGITEPAIYGIAVKYRRALISAMIGGALGGTFMGLMHVKAFAFVFGGLTTLPAFIGSTFWMYVIGLGLCFFGAFASILIMGIGEEKTVLVPTVTTSAGAKIAKASATPKGELLQCPVEGEVFDIVVGADSAFASGSLGPGFLVKPSNDVILAPVDGVVKMLFPTGHAIGFKSDSGAEILIHIGIDTVKLNGKYFNNLVAQGEYVRAGQPVLSFDREAIAEEGYDTSIFVVVTNGTKYRYCALTQTGKMHAGDKVFQVSI